MPCSSVKTSAMVGNISPFFIITSAVSFKNFADDCTQWPQRGLKRPLGTLKQAIIWYGANHAVQAAYNRLSLSGLNAVTSSRLATDDRSRLCAPRPLSTSSVARACTVPYLG